MPRAARIGDDHRCFVNDGVAHRGGAVESGCDTVLIEGRPAARRGDVAHCEGGEKDAIVGHEPTVEIGDEPAARFGDRTTDGYVTSGATATRIGRGPGPSGLRKMLREARRRNRG